MKILSETKGKKFPLTKFQFYPWNLLNAARSLTWKTRKNVKQLEPEKKNSNQRKKKKISDKKLFPVERFIKQQHFLVDFLVI